MRFIENLFARKGRRAAAKSKNEVNFPLFLFDWQVISDKESSIYGIYARREIKKRLSHFAPIVLDPNWRGWDGDMLSPDTMVQLLNMRELSPDLSLISAEMVSKLKSGSMHTIYLLGIGNLERDIICRLDHNLKRDNIVGYLGAILLDALRMTDIAELTKSLALPAFDWWNL